MRSASSFRIVYFLAAAIPGLAATTQTTTPITFDFDVSYVLGTTQSNYSGVGTIQPFGNATAIAVEVFPSGAITTTYTLSSGASFNTSSPGPAMGANGCVVPNTITGGTGMFLNATGSFTLNYACTQVASNAGTFHITGTGTITTTATGSLSLAPTALSFSLHQGGPASASQPVFLNNQTAQAATYAASSGGTSWLSASPATGSAAAFSVATLTITASSAGLAPGTYAGTVTVTSEGQTFPVSVTLTISSTEQELVLSQSAIQFVIAAGSTPPPAQSILITNAGTGSLTWTAVASTLAGKWLSVSPASGAAGDSAAVSVDPTGLQPGIYYGLVTFAAAGAAHSPQSVVVVLNIRAATSTALWVRPTGLIFVASQGSADPAPQTVTVTNSSNQASTVTATTVSAPNGLFSVNIASATVSSGSPAPFAVIANVSGLTPNVYTGNLELQFSDGSTQAVALLLIVTAAPASTRAHAAVSSACTPTKLLPVSTALSQNFSATAAWPTSLQVTVVDDCGSLMGPGDVTASFSTGDPPLPLDSVGNGNWSGTWEPRYTGTSTPVVITMTAESSLPALNGVALISGSLQPNTSTPAINSKGVVSTASYAPDAPLAPGAFASIFGKLLASSTVLAGSLPLGNQLGGAQVIIAGELAPIQYSSSGQINVLIPYDLVPNSTQQLIVQQGMALSTPETITVAPAQPAVFSQDQSGHGPGAITVVKHDGTQFSAGAAHPASAGDALVIYCSGLGAVITPIQAGSASPQSPAAKIAGTITVTIGGKNAPVSFAGLTPTFAGLYQVNVTVPPGITPGPSVPVLLTIGALSSPGVTIAVQ